MATRTKKSHTPKRTAKKTSKSSTFGEILAERGVLPPSKPAESPLPAGLVAKAAERIGITSPELPSVLSPSTDPAMQLAFLKDKLVSMTDLVSEALASVADEYDRDTFDPTTIRDNLDDVLLALFRVRWECYQIGGHVQTAEVAP